MYYHNDFIEDVASFYERLTRKEQYPTVDPQFSDVQSSMVIIPRVTNIRKTMSIKPSSSRSVGQEPPGGWTHHGNRGRKHLCVARGPGSLGAARGGGGGRQLPSQDHVLGQSQSPPATHLQGRGWGNENKTPQCSLPAATPRQMLAVEHILMFYLGWTIWCQWGVEEEYVVGISQLTRSALCFY